MKRWLVAAILLFLVLPLGSGQSEEPGSLQPEQRFLGIDLFEMPIQSRWQIRYHALIFDAYVDHFDEWGTDLYLVIPDDSCYGGLGGRTGSLYLVSYGVGGVERGAMEVLIYGGDWWGKPGDFRWDGSEVHLGNWCAAPVWRFP